MTQQDIKSEITSDPEAPEAEALGAEEHAEEGETHRHEP